MKNKDGNNATTHQVDSDSIKNASTKKEEGTYNKEGKPNDEAKDDALRYRASLCFIAGILCFLGYYFSLAYLDKHIGTDIISKLFETFSIALLTIAAISIQLDLPEWKEYFRNRLADIVVQQKYLYKLTTEELIGLQTNTLKAFFKDENIDREGSFLKYFHSKIHRFISVPYREDIHKIIKLIDDKATPGKYLIQNIISYKCRAIRGKIQEEVLWVSTEEVSSNLVDISLTIKCPPSHIEKCDHKDTCECFATGCKEKEYSKKDLGEFTKDGKLKFPLKDRKGVDGLFVRLEKVYKYDISKFETWEMAHPTKGFTLIIDYPPTMGIKASYFGIDTEETHITDEDGLYSSEYDSWVLVDCGIAFQFTPNRDNGSKARQKKGTAGPTTGEEHPVRGGDKTVVTTS